MQRYHSIHRSEHQDKTFTKKLSIFGGCGSLSALPKHVPLFPRGGRGLEICPWEDKIRWLQITEQRNTDRQSLSSQWGSLERPAELCRALPFVTQKTEVSGCDRANNCLIKQRSSCLLKLFCSMLGRTMKTFPFLLFIFHMFRSPNRSSSRWPFHFFGAALLVLVMTLTLVWHSPYFNSAGPCFSSPLKFLQKSNYRFPPGKYQTEVRTAPNWDKGRAKLILGLDRNELGPHQIYIRAAPNYS